jgi:hypothetical protein
MRRQSPPAALTFVSSLTSIIRKDEYITIAVDDCRNVNSRQQDASNKFARHRIMFDPTALARRDPMFPRNLVNISAFAATIVMGQWASVPAALSESPSSGGGTAVYVPIQSISHEFGSKSMSGYFLQHAGTCRVTLMIIEKSDPEQLPPLSAVRVRLVLNSGQIAGLDSEEGRSLNLTCSEGARTLLVNPGDRDELIARQTSSIARAPFTIQNAATEQR